MHIRLSSALTLLLCATIWFPAPARAQDGLDSALRARAGHAGTSRVIVQSSNTQAVKDAVGRFQGRHLNDLRQAQVVEVPNAKLAELARYGALSLDRVATGSLFRVTGTVGSTTVNTLLRDTGVGVGVAVIDSGITAYHDDLDRRGKSVAAFVDFVNGRKTAYDDWGHATHVADIISGDGFDSNGRHTGLAPASRIVALKALDSNGNGYVSTIIAALQWAVDNRRAHNIRVINISASAPVLESYTTDPLCHAVRDAALAGIVVVASAGNLGVHPTTGRRIWGGIGAPGNCPWALTVGASSDEGDRDRTNDVMASFSSRGPTRFDILAKPDIAAPGTGVVAAIDPRSRLYLEKPGWLMDGTVRSGGSTGTKPYMVLSGSSMSAAVTSGAVALMLQANPALTPNLVKAILQYTAAVAPGYSALEQGAGFIDALGAVRLAEYLRTGRPGDPYPSDPAWSRHLLWGNLRVSGGVISPNSAAWGRDVLWGASSTPAGHAIVWGDNCTDPSCSTAVWGTNSLWRRATRDIITGAAADAAVWGNYWDDNIVWGNHFDDNIVWGNSGDDNIVWGNGADDNIVWGNSADDNIVWGNQADDNIVWGNYSDDNIVWGSHADENIVWGSTADDNIVWGNYGDDNIVWGNHADDNIVWGNYSDDNIVWGNALPDTVSWGY